jgi:hypothetical protein
VLEGGSSDSDGFSACLIGGYPYPLPPDPYSGTVTRSSTRILERKRVYLCYRAFAHLSARARFCIASDFRRQRCGLHSVARQQSMKLYVKEKV